jgi:anti-sigma28 factor (negative regulator of flagellin synthesis)
MKPNNSEFQFAADLNALSDAALGHPALDPARSARIAELRAKFQAGTLPVDDAGLASKLIDAHLNEPIPGDTF